MSPVDSAQSQRYEDLRILALDQQRDVFADAFGRALQLLDRLHTFAVHPKDDVARLHARRRGGTAHVLDDEIAIGLCLLLFLRREGAHRKSELTRLIAVAAVAECRLHLLLIKERDLDVDLLRLAGTPDVELRVGAGFDACDHRRQLRGVVDGAAIDAEHDVAGLKACLLAGTAGLHRAHERAARPVKAKGLGKLRVDVLNGDADAAARDMAGLHQLLTHVHRNIDRDGERQPHVTARAAEDLRVDAHHFALHVEERAAGVARIHGHVRLDEGHVAVAILAGQRTVNGAHDARGRAVLKSERRAYGEHPLARLERIGVADAHDGQGAVGIDLDDGDIRALVDADHLGGELAPVGQSHGHGIRLSDDVRVGQYVAVGSHDEARAFTMRRGLVTAAVTAARSELRSRNAKAAEKILERILLALNAVVFGVLCTLHHLDVHHGRAVALNEGGKIGQRKMRLRSDGGRRDRGGALDDGGICSLGGADAAGRQHDGHQNRTNGPPTRGGEKHGCSKEVRSGGLQPMPNSLTSIVEVPPTWGLRISEAYDRDPRFQGRRWRNAAYTAAAAPTRARSNTG